MANASECHHENERGDDGPNQVELQSHAENGDGPHVAHQYPQFRVALLITVALGLSTLCVALDNTLLATAIPKIVEEFDSLEDMGWYASSYLLTCSAFMLSFGKLYTFYPSKWVYLSSLALFELGSLVSGATPTSIGLILGRAVAGIGAAGLLPGPMIIVRELVPLRQRPTLLAVLGVLPGLAAVCGPILGGVLTERVTWRLCFYINLPIGTVTAIALLVLLRSNAKLESGRRSVRCLDWMGVVLFIPAIVSLFLALQWGGSRYHWTNARIIAMLILAGILGIAWVGVQRWKQEEATVPPRLLKHRDLLGIVLYAPWISGAFTVFIYYLPIWFQAVKGASPSVSGIMNLPMVLGMIIVSFVAAGLVTALGYLTPFLLLGTLITSIGAGLCSTMQPNSGSAQWIGYQAMMGMGCGLGYGLPPLTAQAAVGKDDASVATTLVTFMQNIAGAILVSAAEGTFQNQLIVNLSGKAPGVDPQDVTNGGPRGLRDRFGSDLLPSVLSAYNDSITQTFYIAVAASSLSLVGGLIIRPNLSVKSKNASG